jgi:hypothetical protein
MLLPSRIAVSIKQVAVSRGWTQSQYLDPLNKCDNVSLSCRPQNPQQCLYEKWYIVTTPPSGSLSFTNAQPRMDLTHIRHKWAQGWLWGITQWKDLVFNSSSEPRKTLPQLVTFPTLWPPWPPVIESASNTLPFCPIDSSDSISRPLKLTSWISHPRQSKPHRAHNSERHLLHSHLVSRKWRSVEIRNPKLLPQGGLQTTGRGFSFLYLPTVVNIVSPWRRAGHWRRRF